MQKVFKVLVGLALALVGLGGTAALVGLRLVDRSPWDAFPCAAEVRQHLEALSHNPVSAFETGVLTAGFGRACLTPVLGAPQDDPENGHFTHLPLAGYGDRRGRPATGIHDDLWAKAVAFATAGRTGVVVSADLLIIPREVSEAVAAQLRQECGLERRQVYFGATHTHCSLGGWGEGWVAEAFAGPFQPAVRPWLARQLAAAAKAALADLTPAAAGHGSFLAPEFTRNRLLGDQGPTDPEFSLLLVRQSDGDQAIVGSYSAHATVLPGRFLQFSGDYPGFWQQAVERSPRTLAMFLAGGVGSHAPRPPVGGIEGARRLGDALAEQTLATCRRLTLHPSVRFGLATVQVPLPELQVRVSDQLCLRPWLARRLLPVGTSAPVQALQVGDALWLSTPGDYSGELALALKSSTTPTPTQVTVTSFNGDYIGYIVPAAYYPMNTYETRTMSFFGPQLPDHLQATLSRLKEIAAAHPDPTPDPAAPR